MIAGPTIAPDDEVLTLPQAAAQLGEHRNTTERRVLRGELPARELAGRLFVRAADLEAYRAAATR